MNCFGLLQTTATNHFNVTYLYILSNQQRPASISQAPADKKEDLHPTEPPVAAQPLGLDLHIGIMYVVRLRSVVTHSIDTRSKSAGSSLEYLHASFSLRTCSFSCLSVMYCTETRGTSMPHVCAT
jgi:hypothetical protein